MHDRTRMRSVLRIVYLSSLPFAMRSYWKASGDDWSRSGEDWNGDNDWWQRQAEAHGVNMRQSMYKKVSWCNGSPPPVSGSDSRGWNENPVSCSDWQSSDTRLQTPASGSDSRWWNENPVSRSDWQSSNRGQRSQPAVAAAVHTNASQCLDQPADTFMNEKFKEKLASQVQAAAHARGQQSDTRGTAAAAQTARDTGGAPKAAERWLKSEAMKQGSERVCWGAVAADIAAAHANEYPLPDVSCSDVSAASRGDAPHTNGRDAAFFKAYQVNVHYSKHNAAVKCLREEAESGKFDETGGRLAFGFDTPHNIPRLLRRRSGGEDFLIGTQDDDGFTAWTWEGMIANLDDASIDFVANGTSTPDESAVATQSHGGGACDMAASGTSFDMIASANAESSASWDVIQGDNQQPVHPTCTAVVPYSPRTRTIVGCDFVMDTNRHDHPRLAAAKKAMSRRQQTWPKGKPLYKWGFMIKRDDGTVCLLEPHATDTKVNMYEGVPAMGLDVPRNGLGGSDFKGDYQRRISHNVTRKLRFDATKSPAGARCDDQILSDDAFDALEP